MKKSVECLSEKENFDNAICLTGFGRFHYEIITVCAISIITVGFQNGLLSYVFPAAQCELNLTSFDLGLLNVVFLIGGTTSCFLWGILADVIGRQKILIATHLLNALVTLICAVSSHSFSLFLCRFLNGFFIGGPGSIIFSYIAEFQPPKYSSSIICCCGLFFTLSWLLLPVTAYFVLSWEINLVLNNLFLVTSWRLYMILLVLPEILVGLLLLKMPESPKFFMAQGNPRKALMVLRRMYSRNTGDYPENFPVKNLFCDGKMETHITENEMCRGKTARVMGMVFEQIKSLFKPPLLIVTALTCSIMFANMFGVFGLALWLPEFFIRFENFHKLHPNASVTVKELSSFTPISSNQTNLICEPSFDASVMHSTVAMAMTSLLFNAVCAVISAKVDIRMIPLVSMVLGGISAGCICWITSSVQNLVVACMFQATMITANMTIGNFAVELYPTKVLGIAMCLIMCLGRIGAMCSNIIIGFFIDQDVETAIFIVAGVVLFGGVLCLLVPKKKTLEKKIRKDSCNGEIEVSVIRRSSFS